MSADTSGVRRAEAPAEGVGVERVGPDHWQVTYTVTEQRTRSFWNEEAARLFAAAANETTVADAPPVEGLERFPAVEVDAAARILGVLRDIPEQHRMNAMALAADAFVKLDDTLKENTDART